MRARKLSFFLKEFQHRDTKSKGTNKDSYDRTKPGGDIFLSQRGKMKGNKDHKMGNTELQFF